MSIEADKTRSFTGRRRQRVTSPAVLLADKVAHAVITLGGVGTILAVALVCVFLVWVAVPLFLPESLRVIRQVAITPPPAVGAHPVCIVPDEFATLAWSYLDDGTLRLYRLDTGEQVFEQAIVAGVRPDAWSLDTRTGRAAFAFPDGKVRLGEVSFASETLAAEEVPQGAADLAVGQMLNYQGGVLERTSEGLLRHQTLRLKMQDPVSLGSSGKVRLIDQSSSSKDQTFATLDADGRFEISRVNRTKNLLTGKATTRLTGGTLQLDLEKYGSPPAHLVLLGLGDTAYVIWEDGRAMRIDSREIKQPVAVEELDFLPATEARLTSLGMLNGKTSLVIGDQTGRTTIWFRTKPANATTADGTMTVAAHKLNGPDSPVACFATSARSRLLAISYADGRVRLFHVTSDQQLSEQQVDVGSGPVVRMALAPKDDALVALTSDRFTCWEVRAPHPETTWKSLFLPVWYEGYEGPESVWQSSSGTDDFEPKYGLYPLVFGSLKATFYSMLFGAPLALLAAVYTSEFLHPRVKAKVKPTIEIMASLPSVVLGFLAGIVFAPIMEDYVPQTVAALVTVPLTLLVGAQVWQLLPTHWATFARHYRLIGIAIVLPFGLVSALFTGPLLERWLFAGDIKLWLDGQIGTGVGGWMLLFFPLSAIAVLVTLVVVVNPLLQRWARRCSRMQFAMLDGVKLVVAVLLALLTALTLSAFFTSMGWDPRGSFVGTYVQRNAFVVGIMMGFAIIPIIYTISDDALSAVPDSLRAGSLGCGATPWQTAVRVVIPTAMSGLFSAMMVGLGRAVGETMIVVMATGNTPVTSWNVFNGFRTLSANIATELPEAVQNSTHYRILFLAALTLFCLTFMVNTVAELVRQRFRKRAYQL